MRPAGGPLTIPQKTRIQPRRGPDRPPDGNALERMVVVGDALVHFTNVSNSQHNTGNSNSFIVYPITANATLFKLKLNQTQLT